MTKNMLTMPPATARRLAVVRQHLTGEVPPSSHEHMLKVIRDLGCVQLDPISAVARSHTLVLHSRLGQYDLEHLDKLLWEDRQLFEYWAHAASIVLTEDYPVHAATMRSYTQSTGSNWRTNLTRWVNENTELREHILTSLTQNGAMMSKDFEDKAEAAWASSGWTGGRNVNRMLDYLWTSGTIMVAGRKSGHRLWDLSERCLPEWTPRDIPADDELTRYSAQKALRALGVGTATQINAHYVRGRYPNLAGVLKTLEAEGTIQQVQIVEDGKAWPGVWYVHGDDVALAERLEKDEWQPRTVLLSPFDNLICDRKRTEKMFNFDFRIEIYVPKAQRKYGYYVLPILHGDRLIGRIDPLMDRRKKQLHIQAVFAEADAPMDETTGRAVRGAVENLGAFLDAKEINYGERLPDGWKKALVSS